MSREPADSAVARVLGSIARRDRRLIGVVLASLLSLVAPLSTSAKQPTEAPSMTVTIDVSTRDCTEVRVAYQIEWQGMTPDSTDQPTFVTLVTSPSTVLLTKAIADFDKKADKSHGKLRGELIEGSGYFDHQTYPGLSYQLAVQFGDGQIGALSNVVAIPECVPMSPLSGPAAGGTEVTIVGGGTFGSNGFTAQSVVNVGGLEVIPIEVAADGTWLRFVAPAGDPGTCVGVFVDGMVFPLPSFCYET